jgi:hypothetical protein
MMNCKGFGREWRNWGVIPEYSWKDQGKLRKKSQPEYLVSRPRYKPSTSRIWVERCRSANPLGGRPVWIFSLLSLFWKNRVGLWDLVAVCVCIPSIVARQRLAKNPRIVARQRLGRNVNAVTNTHGTIEKLLNVSFSIWPVSYQGN